MSSIDDIIAEAGRAHEAARGGDWQTAAQLYRSSSDALRAMLRSGKVADARSQELLGKKCDEFKRDARHAEGKAQEAYEKRLVGRMRQLKGLAAKPLQDAELEDAEGALRARFAKLQASSDGKPAASTTELADRLDRLGPSQFPAASSYEPKAAGADADDEDDEEDDPRVLKAIADAQRELDREAGGAGAGGGEDANDNDDVSPQLAAMLNRIGADDVSDDVLAQLLGESGLGPGLGFMDGDGDGAQGDDIAGIIRKTRELARFTDHEQAAKLRSKNEAAAAAEEGGELKPKSKSKPKRGDDSASDSSLSDSESDDSDDDRRRSSKKKKKKKKKGKGKGWF